MCSRRLRQMAAIEILDDQGAIRLKIHVHQPMFKGVSVCHGGILFTLADTVLADALLSEGFAGFGIEGSIHFLCFMTSLFG